MIALALALVTDAHAWTDTRFDTAIERVERMVWDEDVRRMADREGLSVVNVTWEDTGRSKGSVWGPNISDLTIGVRDGRGQLHPMPVLRFDNYHDVTADLRSDDMWLRVGNERGGALRPVTLASILQSPASYLHDAYTAAGRVRSLWDSRDADVLVSAQACFLPIPQGREATFTPVIYNYQSSPGNPAVLTMVATREGTSIQVVDNSGGYMSEVLTFNDDGERAPFTATRLSDYARKAGSAAASQPGLDMVMIVQVPLLHREPRRPAMAMGGYDMAESDMAAAPSARSNVETAVIGHGPTEGPFAELRGVDVRRDTRFPVRVTVQFYRATSDGVVDPGDIADIRDQIDRVYADARFVGSLVTDGWTGRPTESVHTPPPPPPPTPPTASWAHPFWSWR